MNSLIRTLLGGILAVWLLPGTAFVASAQDKPAPKLADRYVIAVDADHEEIVVDAGRADGLEAGSKVQLFTSVKMKHPITRKTLVDLVPLTTLEALRVGDGVAVLKPDKQYFERVKVGDVIRFRSAPAVPEAVVECPVRQCPECKEDPDLLKVQEAWVKTLSAPIDHRLAVWQEFLKSERHNRYVANIRNEVKKLHELKDLIWLGQIEKKQRENQELPTVEVTHYSTTKVPEFSPLTAVVGVISNKPLATVNLLWKKSGEERYHLARMDGAGDTAYRASFPKEALGQGRLDYFIAGMDRNGQAVALRGLALSPLQVELEPAPAVRPQRKGRSKASAYAEWVDFYLKNPGTDAYWKTEADYTYRLKLWKLYSFRMGFGLYQGEGGPVECVEDPESCSNFESVRVAVGYAFFEPELALGDKVHLIPRLVVGSIQEKQDPYNPDRKLGESMLGFHTYIRVGDEEATNLLAGVSFTEQLGVEALLAMNLAIFPKVPIGISAMATNFPVGEDYAARLLAKVGYKPADWISLESYFGVNMRNIRHLGVGAGAGVTLNW